MKTLIGKTVLITGAASGIGKSLALKMLLDEKCKLILLDKNSLGLNTLFNSLDNKKDVRLLPCDISNSTQIDNCVL